MSIIPGRRGFYTLARAGDKSCAYPSFVSLQMLLVMQQLIALPSSPDTQRPACSLKYLTLLNALFRMSLNLLFCFHEKKWLTSQNTHTPPNIELNDLLPRVSYHLHVVGIFGYIIRYFCSVTSQIDNFISDYTHGYLFNTQLSNPYSSQSKPVYQEHFLKCLDLCDMETLSFTETPSPDLYFRPRSTKEKCFKIGILSK